MAQIRPSPFKISFGSLNMFCSIQNSEQVLFWQKFDFYSNFGSNLQKREWIMPATVIRCGPRALLPRTAAARATPRASPPPRSCLPACVARYRGSSASSPLAIKAAPPADALPFASESTDKPRPRHREICRRHALFTSPVCSVCFARDPASS